MCNIMGYTCVSCKIEQRADPLKSWKCGYCHYDNKEDMHQNSSICQGCKRATAPANKGNTDLTGLSTNVTEYWRCNYCNNSNN